MSHTTAIYLGLILLVTVVHISWFSKYKFLQCTPQLRQSRSRLLL